MVRQMGLLERIKAESLPPRPMIVLDYDGLPLQQQQPEQAEPEPEEYEIERNVLLDLFFGEVREHVAFIFSDSIVALEESAEQVDVSFISGRNQAFSLVVGCDGSHSTVRRLCFGEEASFLTFLKNYFSLTIVPRLLIEENTSEMFNVPGRSVVLNAYNGKTNIVFSFASESEIPYDRKDQGEQKRMIRRSFEGSGWRTAELLDEMDSSDNAYFNKYCQPHMSSRTKGRVALVGDAAYARHLREVMGVLSLCWAPQRSAKPSKNIPITSPQRSRSTTKASALLQRLSRPRQSTSGWRRSYQPQKKPFRGGMNFRPQPGLEHVCLKRSDFALSNCS